MCAGIDSTIDRCVLCAMALTADEKAARISDWYGLPEQVMSDSTPRFFGQRSFVISYNGLPAASSLLQPQNDVENYDYLRSLLLYSVIGLCIAIIAFFTIWIFMIARRCCRTGCGGSEAAPYGYDKKQRWMPYGFLCAFSVVAA